MEKSIPNLRPAPFLVIVVPCYNEREVLPATLKTLATLLKDMKARGLARADSVVCYVDDGSRDTTWEILEEAHKADTYCRAIKFAGNAGHQNALWAGMEAATQWGADCAISMDADLQDDPGIMPQMLSLYAEGYDIVYGVRDNRASDTTFKRVTAHWFYGLMGKLNVAMIPDHADYRLVAGPVLRALADFGERDLFLRGLFPVLGFRTARVPYTRRSRVAGESKYPLKKMIAFAWRGITSCSAAPLRVAGLMSFICMLFALILCFVSIFKYAAGETIQGWTSLIIVILFLGSVQLFCLAVMGEYIAKIFTEVRRRPRYIIEKEL